MMTGKILLSVIPQMPALPTNSNIILLSIWHISLLLAMLSITIMLSLVVYRTYRKHKNDRILARQLKLSHLVQTFLNAPLTLDQLRVSLPKLDRKEMFLVCDILLNLLRAVRGDEEEKINNLLRIWQVKPVLKKGLKGKRSDCIRALTLYAHLDDAESRKMLLDFVANSDMYVQLTALRGLAYQNAVEELPKVFNILCLSEQKNISILSDILQRFGTEAIPFLCAVATSQSLVEIRLSAIMALGRIGAFEAIDILVSLSTDKDGNIRAQAVSALGKIGGPPCRRRNYGCIG